MDVLKEIADCMRDEANNSIAPVAASLNRLADSLDRLSDRLEAERAKRYEIPMVLARDVVIEDPKPDADVKLPTEPDDLESLDQ
jgi:hypothetical protein